MQSTSDGISADDWDRVWELSADIVNASAEGKETEVNRTRAQLFAFLNELEAIYGRKPSLLATRADFSEPSAHSRALLIEAYALAEVSGDFPNQWLTAESLFAFYTDDFPDQQEALRWMQAMERLIPLYPFQPKTLADFRDQVVSRYNELWGGADGL